MTIGRMAVILGYFFLLLGILGFIPGITTAGGYLLGIFHVNAVHNIVHLLTGGVFLWAGRKSECSALRTFQVFTFVYGLITLVGLFYVSSMMIGPMAINFADTLFHAAVTVFALYYGFLSGLRRTVQCPA